MRIWMTCDLRSDQVQKLKWLWKLPFCEAIKHIVAMDKIFVDSKTGELAMLIDSCFFETKKTYV